MHGCLTGLRYGVRTRHTRTIIWSLSGWGEPEGDEVIRPKMWKQYPPCMGEFKFKC
jgi:hypothetical protein